MSRIEIKSLVELQTWAHELLPILGDKRLILLSGPMGAGKTEFVRALCRELGMQGVSSPTYAIHQRYENENKSLHHVDLYRLEDAADLESSGFWDLFLPSKGWIVVEWADRLDPQVWPHDWPKWQMNFSVNDRGLRTIEGFWLP